MKNGQLKPGYNVTLAVDAEYIVSAMVELQLKHYCYLLKSDLFELSVSEIRAYFKLFGYVISAATARQVHEISEGWISAIYLIMQRYAETGRLEPGRDLESQDQERKYLDIERIHKKANTVDLMNIEAAFDYDLRLLLRSIIFSRYLKQ